MNKQLHELFNLPGDEDNESLDAESILDSSIKDCLSEETLDSLEKIESALPAVRGLESSDKEMDELADLAKEAFNNLIDLGMQVESRFSAEIFNSASSFLGHAITARTAKVNKKLKMLDLQLKKAELDRKVAIDNAKELPVDTTPLGTGQVIDRNSLIREILEQSKLAAQDK